MIGPEKLGVRTSSAPSDRAKDESAMSSAGCRSWQCYIPAIGEPASAASPMMTNASPMRMPISPNELDILAKVGPTKDTYPPEANPYRTRKNIPPTRLVAPTGCRCTSVRVSHVKPTRWRRRLTHCPKQHRSQPALERSTESVQVSFFFWLRGRRTTGISMLKQP